MLIFNPMTPIGAMALHPLTLVFRGRHRHLEKAFSAQYFGNNLFHLRLCHWLTIFFYSLPGLLDASFFPEMKVSLWTIRYLVVCPVFLLGFAFTYTSAYRRWWQGISMGYILLTGGGFIWMIAIATPPASYGYYVGIIISLMFGYTLIRERFIYASAAGMILLVAYLVVSLAATSIPANLLFHNGLFTFVTNMLGMLIAYFLEFSARRDFFLGYMLQREQEKVNELNVELEEKVAQRTQALSAANQALHREIHERETIAAALREDRERLKVLFDFAPDGYCMLSPAGDIIEGNRSAETISGYTREELIGRNVLKLGLIAPNSYFQAREARNTSRQGIPWGPAEFTIICKDGNTATAEVRSHPVRFHQRDCILIMVRDLTAQKAQTRAREQLEKQLAHAQKMEAVGTLAGGIAHDFNNILSAIIGYTELSRLDAVPGSTLHANLDQINKAGLRAKELVQQILTFSRQDDIEVKPVKVRALIEESLNFLRASISKTIDIRANIASEAYALASPTQVQQILMNLCTNAAHAMGNHGGIIEVALTDVVIDRTAFGQDINLPSGDYIRISVRDTGCGMPPQVMERIFDPYFTTKSEGEGSGLGMAVVHGIVSRYGGTIKVCSEESRGTTVNVYLPCQTDATPEKGEASNATPHGKEAILLVDDEPQLVAIENSMLTRLGYRVTTSQDSIEALEIFRRQPTAFDVVVTDMSMPKMNGLEFSQAVLAIRSDTPIIICTGYSAGLTQEKAHSVGVHGILMKPISMQTLAQSIRQAIDGDHISSR